MGRRGKKARTRVASQIAEELPDNAVPYWENRPNLKREKYAEQELKLAAHHMGETGHSELAEEVREILQDFREAAEVFNQR